MMYGYVYDYIYNLRICIHTCIGKKVSMSWLGDVLEGVEVGSRVPLSERPQSVRIRVGEGSGSASFMAAKLASAVAALRAMSVYKQGELVSRGEA